MSRGLNKVMIIGHLGRDPEMRYTPTNRPVATFSLASSRNWATAEGEKRSATEWFNVVAWGSLAEICNQFLKKGQQVSNSAVGRCAGQQAQHSRNRSR
jgi:single-strand DNA-binding protein